MDAVIRFDSLGSATVENKRIESRKSLQGTGRICEVVRVRAEILLAQLRKGLRP